MPAVRKIVMPPQHKTMHGAFRVALTGGIGSGKSAVADRFASLGVDVIDADVLAHELTAAGQPATLLIEKQLGPGLVDANGVLQRTRLRQIVFTDEKKRIALQNILHPLIRQQMHACAAQCTKSYCLFVIPLLIESGQRDMAERVLVVDAPTEVCVQRVMARDKQSREAVLRIIAVQATRTERLSIADDVLVNNRSLPDVHNAVEKLHQKYLHIARKIC